MPISLIEIVRLVDLGYIDPTKLIDLPTLIGTRKLRLRDEVGVMLTCEVRPRVRVTKLKMNRFEGCSSLSFPLHLEVQATDEESIGAIEKEGGTIRVAYYDAISLKVSFKIIVASFISRPVDENRVRNTGDRIIIPHSLANSAERVSTFFLSHYCLGEAKFFFFLLTSRDRASTGCVNL